MSRKPFDKSRNVSQITYTITFEFYECWDRSDRINQNFEVTISKLLSGNPFQVVFFVIRKGSMTE